MRYLRLLPLPLLALAGWWGFERLETTSEARFAAAEALLRNHHVLEAGPVALAGCGRNGCADASDNIYRLGAGKTDCFVFKRAPEPDALGTGMLLASGSDGARLVLLDLDGAGVTPLGSRVVKRIPCPPVAPRS